MARAVNGHNGRMHEALSVDAPAGRPLDPPPAPRRRWWRTRRATTLIEVMISMWLLATVMLGFLGAFLQSRRFTESSVLNAACTSLIYGLIEQMKGLSYGSKQVIDGHVYSDSLPNSTIDENDPNLTGSETEPFNTIRLRVNQDLTVWLRAVYTPAPGAPAAPTTCPAPTATAASVGAINNALGNLPLSTVTGTRSQDLAVNLWVWIDEIPNAANDVSEVKKITVVYTYSYRDGSSTRTVRDMEVFLRTRYDQ